MSAYAEKFGTVTLHPHNVPSWAPQHLRSSIPEEGREFTIVVDSKVNGGGTRLTAGSGSDLVCISQCLDEWIGADHPAIAEGRKLTEMEIAYQRSAGLSDL